MRSIAFSYCMKLLWENIKYFYCYICQHCRDYAIRCPCNKYLDVAEPYLLYCKKKKREVSRIRMLMYSIALPIGIMHTSMSNKDGLTYIQRPMNLIGLTDIMIGSSSLYKKMTWSLSLNAQLKLSMINNS